MSSSLVDGGARLRALSERRAVPIAGRQRVRMQANPLLISAAAMTGEHASPWGVSVLWRGKSRAAYVVVGTPSEAERRFVFWAELGKAVKRYGDWCVANKVAPQVVVATSDVWKRLQAGAFEACRHAWKNPDIRCSTDLFLFLSEVADLPGSESLVVAKDVLLEHVVTGNPLDERYLSDVLDWVEGAPVASGDRPSSPPDDDCTTPPDDQFDRKNTVREAVKKTVNAKNTTSRDKHGKAVQGEMRWLLDARMARLVRFVEAYERLGLTPFDDDEVGDVARTRKSHASAWAKRRAAANSYGIDPKPYTRIVQFKKQEEAGETWEQVLRWHDPKFLVRDIADGYSVQGTVESVDGDLLNVLTTQPLVRARQGDEMALHSEGSQTFEVIETERDKPSGGTLIKFRVRDGRTPEPLYVGQEVTLSPARNGSMGSLLRADDLTWTHDVDSRPSSIGRATSGFAAQARAMRGDQ